MGVGGAPPHADKTTSATPLSSNATTPRAGMPYRALLKQPILPQFFALTYAQACAYTYSSAINSARDDTPDLRRMRLTWVSTVRLDSESLAAI